jgi:hypothetical protein
MRSNQLSYPAIICSKASAKIVEIFFTPKSFAIFFALAVNYPYFLPLLSLLRCENLAKISIFAPSK